MSHLPGGAASCSIVLLHGLFVLTTTLLLLLAVMLVVVSTTAASPDDVLLNMTRPLTTNASSVEVPPNWETYSCFLCTGRHPLLIHTCPIYWDECHLTCWFDIPDAPSPPAPPLLPSPSTDHSMDTVQGKELECYVMKLYNSGRYVIVQRLNCDVVVKSGCFLTCGGGELDDQKVAMGTTVVPPPTIQGAFLPSELCNSQVNPLRAPPSAAAAGGVVVPAGGAH